MRKINGKLFLALLVGLAVLTGGTFALHYFQYNRIARALLFQADRARDNSETREEAEYLRRYLEFNPRDQDETARLARLWASDAYPPNSRQRRQSIGLMDQVLAYKDDPDLRRLLVKTALDLRPPDLRRAGEHLERLLPREQLDRAIAADRKVLRSKGKEPMDPDFAGLDPSRGELEAYWGLILEDGKDPVAALHCHRLAILHSPETQVSYRRLAYLLRRQTEADPDEKRHNQEEADRVIDLLVARNKESHEAHLTRWRYRRDFNLVQLREGDAVRIDLTEAARDVTDALRRKPESVEVLLAAADLERLRARAAGEDGGKPVSERRQTMKEHRDQAARHLERGLEIVAKNPAATTDYGRFQLLWHRANLLLDDLEVLRTQRTEDGKPQQGDRQLKEQIAGVIEQIRRSPVPAAADYVRGRLHVHEMQWQEAASLFEQARALLNEQPEMACQANLYLGQCYEKLEEHEQMYGAYEAVWKRDPSSLPAQLGMAKARWLQGQLVQAKQLYGLVLREKRIPAGGWLDVARLEIQIQLQQDHPHWDAVEHALKNAENANPKAAVEVALLRYEVKVRKGDKDAREFLETQRTLTPKEADVHAALIDWHLRQKDLKRAKAALEVGRREAGDRASLRLAEARLLAVEQGKAANPAVAALAQKAGKMPEEERSRLLAGLAEVLTLNDDAARARKVWQTLSELPMQKNNLRLRLLLFDLAMTDGDEEGMAAVLEDVRRVEQKSGSYHRYGQALFYVRKARVTSSPSEKEDYLRRAEVELDQVRRQRAAWSPVNVALAEIAELRGASDKAEKHLQDAQSNGDNSASTMRKLLVLRAKKNPEAARELMATLSKRMRQQAELWTLDVGLEARRGNYKKAYDVAREMLGDSKEPRSMMLMAGLLLETWRQDRDEKKLAEAGRLLDQAVELSLNDPEPYLGKVQFLVAQKRKKEAVAVVAVLRKKFTNKQAGVELGRCYDLIGEPKKVVECFDEAVEKNPGDAKVYRAAAAAHLQAGRNLRAEDLLRAMATAKMSGLPSPEVADAQRKLALLLSAGTDFRRFSEALTLVGLAVDDQGRLKPTAGDGEVELQRARARVLASQSNQKQFRAEAIRLFEKLRDAKALQEDDRFILARLYDVEGESQKSRDDLKALVGSPSPNPRYLAHYVQLLIARQMELDEAEKKIALLEKLEEQTEAGANGFGSVDLRTQLLERRGKPGEALKLMRAHVAKKPAEVFLLITALCRQGKFTDAHEVCEGLWKEAKHPAELLGAASVGVVQVWKDAPDEQVRAVAKHLEKALAKAVADKKPTALLRLQLAQMHDKRGQYDRAADELRAVLDEQPNNVVALNNLAWLLALRSGDGEKALVYVEKAIAGMGRRADLLDTRAMVRLALKQPDRAVADLKEAVQDGATANRLYRLARAHHENREQDKARAALEQAKAKGLEVAALHPVEHEEAKKLLAEYR